MFNGKCVKIDCNVMFMEDGKMERWKGKRKELKLFVFLHSHEVIFLS